MRRILVVFGTRPEAVKLAPVVTAMRAHPALEPVVAVTGQHREMLTQVLDRFGVAPDFDLALQRPGQSLISLTSRALSGLEGVMSSVDPSAVLVQGDTSTTFAASLAAFYDRRPLVHLEAGLRTGSLSEPFPEEANRRLTGRIAELHLAATPANRDALLAEGVPASTIVVTGNTVIDALEQARDWAPRWDDARLGGAVDGLHQRMVLVTAHRRESWGTPLERVAAAVAAVATSHPHVQFIWPVHGNPAVRGWIEPAVRGLPNVLLSGPASYGDFVRLLSTAHIALTDSGGVQEEAPAIGLPVLVARNSTERQEAVDAGVARLVGTDPHLIASALRRLLDEPDAYAAMAVGASPYGDGHAVDRAVAAIAELLGVGQRLPEFVPRSRTYIEALTA